MNFIYISHADCHLHDIGHDHPECPERLDAINDRLIASGVDFTLLRETAQQATPEQLYRAHDKTYVDNILAHIGQDGRIHLDEDTVLMERSVDAALLAAGANVQAVDAVMQERAGQAFCAVRPPGHHAGKHQAMGFCVFNNVAVAATHAMEVYGLTRVAIIDFDVHHGNGTEDIFFNDERVMLCSSYQYPFYPYNVGPGNGHILNLPLPAGTGSEEFQMAVQQKWLDRLDEFAPQLILFSAGFDGHFEDEMGQFQLVETDYDWITRAVKCIADKHCGGKMVSTLEGGYALNALGRSAVVHIKAMMG